MTALQRLSHGSLLALSRLALQVGEVHQPRSGIGTGFLKLRPQCWQEVGAPLRPISNGSHTALTRLSHGSLPALQAEPYFEPFTLTGS